MILDDWRGHLTWMFEESERTGKPLAFDGYAGLGGWDSGLDAEGFLVLGCEINPKIAELNPYPMICADFTTLNPGDFKGFDLIVGSPPCRDFCIIARTLGHRWKDPPDPEGRGMSLVNAFLKFVETAKPKYWLMENSILARKYIPIPERQLTRLGRGMPRCFWGNYPSFLVTRDFNKTISNGNKRLEDPPGVSRFMKSFVRARIPLPVARALGAAVKQALETEA